jgi:hypothetical protein
VVVSLLQAEIQGKAVVLIIRLQQSTRAVIERTRNTFNVFVLHVLYAKAAGMSHLDMQELGDQL